MMLNPVLNTCVLILLLVSLSFTRPLPESFDRENTYILDGAESCRYQPVSDCTTRISFDCPTLVHDKAGIGEQLSNTRGDKNDLINPSSFNPGTKPLDLPIPLPTTYLMSLAPPATEENDFVSTRNSMQKPFATTTAIGALQGVEETCSLRVNDSILSLDNGYWGDGVVVGIVILFLLIVTLGEIAEFWIERLGSRKGAIRLDDEKLDGISDGPETNFMVK
ncbi:hypothetical protein DL98DRAFT_539581 [Cadophora sp. DSE1049]|nr:hypothetical protein DL98DRAFT_539581 [Cadophora sp. DSE1049]